MTMASPMELSLGMQEMQRTLQTQSLELTYENSLRASSLIYEQEKARQLRVAGIFLEDENYDLYAQLSQSDCRIDDLERSAQDMQSRMGILEVELGDAKSELRVKSREVETFRAELESLHGVSMDSTKLLTEKLALSRDLAALKPEIEHLRSQAITHQTLFAEKLSLQRQLSTTQVELETEKRVTQRTLAKEESRHELDARMESQLEELRSELAKERKETQKLQREMHKLSTDFDGKKAILESRLDAFRYKLNITKDQLKETQKELHNTRASNPAQSDPSAKARQPTQNTRKRNISQFDTDAMIGTPGDLPPTKKGKRGSTVPGDKSTFSITPYLNRSASIAPLSPSGSKPALEEESDVNPTHISAEGDSVTVTNAKVSDEPMTENGKESGSRQAVASKNIALLTVKARKDNAKREVARKRRVASALEQVQEEHNENEDENHVSTEAHDIGSRAIATKKSIQDIEKPVSNETTFIKKKRKVLGVGLAKTLFDEEDMEGSRGGSRVLFGSSRGINGLGRTGLAGITGIRAGLSASDANMGTFSPLKRDRRPVGKAVSNF